MSEEVTIPDVVLLWQRAVHAGNARDIDTLMRFYASDSVYYLSPVGMGTFEGCTALRNLFEDWWNSFQEYEQEAEETHDLGSGVTFSIIVRASPAAQSPSVCGDHRSRPQATGIRSRAPRHV